MWCTQQGARVPPVGMLAESSLLIIIHSHTISEYIPGAHPEATVWTELLRRLALTSNFK